MRNCYANHPLSLYYEATVGDSIWCLSAHTLSGVHNNRCHPSCREFNCGVGQDRRICIQDSEAALQLQPPEQFVQWRLNTDVEFAEVGVLGADRIEAHL